MNAFPSGTTLNQSAAWPPTPTPAARPKRSEAPTGDTRAAESAPRKRLNSEEDIYPSSNAAAPAPAPTARAAEKAREAEKPEWQPYDMSKHAAQVEGRSADFAAQVSAWAALKRRGEKEAADRSASRSKVAFATSQQADRTHSSSFSFSRNAPETPIRAPALPSQWLAESDSPEDVSMILRKSSTTRARQRSSKVATVAKEREKAEAEAAQAQIVALRNPLPDAVVKDPTLTLQPQWIPAGRTELMQRVKYNALMWAALVIVPKTAAFQAVYWMLLDAAYAAFETDKEFKLVLFLARWALIFTSMYNIGDAVLRIRSLPAPVDKPKRAPGAPRPSLHDASGYETSQPEPSVDVSHLADKPRDPQSFNVYSGGTLRAGMEAARRIASRSMVTDDDSLGRSFSSSFNGDMSRSGIDNSSPLASRSVAPGGIYGSGRRVPTSNAVPAPHVPPSKPSNMSAYFAHRNAPWGARQSEDAAFAQDSIIADRAVRSISHSLTNPKPVKPSVSRKSIAGTEVLPKQQPVLPPPPPSVPSPVVTHQTPVLPSYPTPQTQFVSNWFTPSQPSASAAFGNPAPQPRTPVPVGSAAFAAALASPQSSKDAAGVDALL